MATVAPQFRGRAPGFNWMEFSGSMTLNGTTDVTDTLKVEHPAIRGIALFKVTSGSGTGVVTVSLWRPAWLAEDSHNLIDEAMPAISGGLSNEEMLIGESATFVGQAAAAPSLPGIIIPPGDYTLQAVVSAAEVGTLSYEIWMQVG